MVVFDDPGPPNDLKHQRKTPIQLTKCLTIDIFADGGAEEGTRRPGQLVAGFLGRACHLSIRLKKYAAFVLPSQTTQRGR